VIDKILLAESDEYTNYPTDRGGPTKFGITLNTLRSISPGGSASAENVKALTRERAAQIYADIYVKPFLFITSDTVFQFVVNAAVQHGVTGATKMLQRALKVDDDGVIGPATIQVADAVDPTQFLAKLTAERCKYYANILQKDHTQREFASGWLNRLARDLS